MPTRRTPTKGIVAAVVLALVTLGACAASALASPAWLPAETLPSGAAPELPAIAANASGDSVVVWEEGGSDKTVKAAYRPAGGVFTAPDSIGVSNQLGTSPPSRPVVAIDPEGNVLALWRRIADGVHSRVQAAFRPAGGAWSAVQELTPADAFGGNPDVVADEHGGFLVGWLLGTVSAVVQVSRATSGGGFGPVDTISNTGAGTPDLAVNGDGDAVATWIRTEGTLSFVEARTAAAGQPFRDPQVLSPTDSNADQPVAAVAPDGRATVVWTQLGAGSDPNSTVEAAPNAGPGSDFGMPQILSASGRINGQPDVGVDAAGTFTAVWVVGSTSHPPPDEADAAVRAAGTASWSDRQVVATGGQIGHTRVAVAPDGEAILVWEDGVAGTESGAVRDAGQGSLGPPHVLANQGQPGDGRVAVDRAGNGFATWFGDTVQVAGYDAAGPVFTAVGVPQSGTAGAPVVFSASARDVWSGVSAIEWDFGDGTSGSGASVAHAYGSPGSYSVVLRAVDGVGNATVARRTVQIGSAAGGPGAGGLTGAQIPLGPLAPAPRARIGAVAKVVDGVARVKLACTRTAACAGRIALTHSGNAARVTTLGKARFSVPAGKRRTVNVRLRRAARRLVRRHKNTRAQATLALRRPGSPSLPLRGTIALRRSR